ncbi:bile acid:sodium symporter family protein [Desulfotomaculum copahuensis]|uniref:Bile acid:sodium symporter n=1 Tax=Desulfotomaculum copahuensis TaxID=1838280 RepID=A0A1B7LGY2_9FIRM|nr:bile acid:sodium symporter [Desulfotomaculum copahuensis]OAT85308.1 bile acid:sodium symporter [Desulfotomaculum copahuensis]
MLDYFACWNQWLGRRMFFVVLSALLAGFLMPLPHSPVLATTAVALFAYMTFITALDTGFRDFFHVLARPWITIWMLLLIHVVMPLVAWGAGLLFYPHAPLTRLGFLIGAAIPIGVTSIIWTSVVRGDVALALVAVTLDTLVSPLLLPAFIALVAGREVHVDYVRLLVGLLWMVTIPSLAGMAVNDLTRRRLTGFSHSVGGFTSKVALFLVVFINAGAVAPEINWNASLLKLLLVILLLVMSGYYIGYAGSFVLNERRRDTVAAMIYNVGMRNISFGAVLAVAYFPAAVAVPVTLAMIFQQPLAAVVSYLFNRFDRSAACVPELTRR